MQKTQVLDSTIGALLPFFDSSKAFPSGPALELINPGSSTVYMKNLFLDEDIRISLNEADDTYFVFNALA